MPSFFHPVALSQPIPADLRAGANQLLVHGQSVMPWTAGMQGQATIIMNAGQWPQAAAPADVSSDPAQQEQWRQFTAAYNQISNQVIRGEMAAAKAASAQYEADAAFWDRVHGVLMTVATAGLSDAWDRLSDQLQQFKDARRATAAAINTLQATAASPIYGPRIPQAKTYLAQLTGQQAEIDNGGKSALGPVAKMPEAQAAGLGAVPGYVIGAGIAAVTLVAIASAFAYWVKRQADLKTQANTFAQDVMRAREAADLEDYRAGRITKAEYERRRAANTQQAIDLSNAMGGSGVGLKLLLGGAAVLGVILLLAKATRSSGSSAPAAQA